MGSFPGKICPVRESRETSEFFAITLSVWFHHPFVMKSHNSVHSPGIYSRTHAGKQLRFNAALEWALELWVLESLPEKHNRKCELWRLFPMLLTSQIVCLVQPGGPKWISVPFRLVIVDLVRVKWVNCGKLRNLSSKNNGGGGRGFFRSSCRSPGNLFS